MKFACPKCGATEIVIGDDKPSCLRCRVPMIKAMSGYTDLFMSPNIAIRRFETVIGKRGYWGALSGSVKREREAWITAVWALGLRELTKKQYWIEIETRDQTPDCKVHSIDQSSGYNRILTHNVEVVEWDSHRPDVLDVITQKCKKAYPSYFILLVFARNGKEILVTELLQHIQTLRVPVAEIWILGRMSALSAKYANFMAYPTTNFVGFDLVEALQNNAQPDFLQRQKRGKGTEMKDLGIAYLPFQ